MELAAAEVELVVLEKGVPLALVEVERVVVRVIVRVAVRVVVWLQVAPGLVWLVAEVEAELVVALVQTYYSYYSCYR